MALVAVSASAPAQEATVLASAQEAAVLASAQAAAVPARAQVAPGAVAQADPWGLVLVVRWSSSFRFAAAQVLGHP